MESQTLVDVVDLAASVDILTVEKFGVEIWVDNGNDCWDERARFCARWI